MERNRIFRRWRLDVVLLLLLLLALPIILVWATRERVADYKAHELRNAMLATGGSAKEIAAELHGLERSVALFAAKELPLLERFAGNPDNDALYGELERRVKAVFPEAFAVTLADKSGQPLRTDFDGLVGQLCQQDIVRYARDPKGVNIYIHPNTDTYHFDVMSPVSSPAGQSWVFFMSFDTRAIARVLGNYQLYGHTLFLMRRDVEGLIEVSPAGTRDMLQRDFRMTAAELARINAKAPIEGTLWHVVDLPDTQVQDAVVKRLWVQAWVILSVMALFSIVILYNLVVTARRQRGYTRMLEHTADQLHESAQRIHAIVDSAIDAVITINRRGIIESFNPAAERMFGYLSREVIGQNIKMLMPEPYQSEHDGYLARYLQTGERRILGFTREISARRKDGDVFPIELSISESRLGDEPFFTGMIRDISQRQKLDRFKQEFVSTVSHELRTPLTAIKGALGLLVGGVAGALPEQASQLLDISMKNRNRLNLLINDILDMEKIESGKIRFDIQCLELRTLLEQAIEHNLHYASQYGVRYELTQAIPGIWVNVDPDRLEQVLANLLSNAAKFSPAHGVVSVRMERQDGKDVRVSIRDHGAGIPEAFRERIFQKFAQADASDAREKGGSGLGLSICKALIERMGGQIGYDSVPGEGATFYFDLPSCKTSGQSR